MKRICALLLSVCLLVSMIPVNAISTRGAEVSSDGVVTAGTAYATPGTTVSIDLEIRNNPGILGMTLKVEYDESKAILTGVENGTALSYMTFTTPKALGSGCQLPWDAEEVDAESLVDGVIATLTFQILETVNENTSIDICLSYDAGAIIDENMNPLSITLENGKVQVISYTPGDVNEDGLINSTDVVYLRRYIAGGYGVTINEAAADVNDDGLINTTDAVYIRRFVAGGYGVKLKPHTPRCTHTMEAIPAKAATCTEDGNSAYYHCTTCDKYFSDSNGSKEITLESTVITAPGHTEVIDPYVAPTPTECGWTEGKHCSVCGEILVPQVKIAPIPEEAYFIRYDCTEGREYLQALENAGTLVNDNPISYTEQDTIKLKNLNVVGYTFKGWFDGPWKDANRVTTISNQTGELYLYAQWEPITYKVTYDTPDVDVKGTKVTGETVLNYTEYTVETGCTLTNPSWFGYTFVGWSDDGKIVSSIPVGTTGNKTLHANWTSDRNRAVAVSTYDKPMIIEDMENGQYLFIYEIGTIKDVPLETIAPLGKVDSALELKETYTYSQSVGKIFTDRISETLSKATTTTSSWTLSEDWNDASSASTAYEEEIGKTKETVDSQGNIVEGKYYISNVQGGSTSTTNSAGYSGETSAKITMGESTGIKGSYTRENELSTSVGVQATVSASASAEAGVNVGDASVKAGYEVEASLAASANASEKEKESATTSAERSANFGTEREISKNCHWDTSGTSESQWNTTESYEAATSTSKNTQVSNAISEIIYNKRGYSSTIERGGENSTTQSSDNSSSEAKEYSSTVEYSEGEEKSYSIEMKSTYTTAGYYRLVSAGTVHVFAVVGYDVATNAYFTYTYNILDSERHVFMDYSKTDSSFTDCENAILPFEVPYSVHEFVSSAMASSSDLTIDEETGIVNAYTGNAEYVLIPEYVSASDGKSDPYAVKVTGISASAFAGNENIKGIYLPKYISSIPDGAFKNCSSLELVIGYGISEVGANAFAGCTALKNFNVDKYIDVLGENAFEDVPAVTFVAANESVAEAATNSGARSITLDISGLRSFDNQVVTVPASTKSFILIGNSSNGVTYRNLRIESDAEETFISNMTFVDNQNTPLKIGSETVTFSRVKVEDAPGFATILTADHVALNLYGTISLSSSGDHAMISKNVTLAQLRADISGELRLTGNYYVCGEIENSDMLTFTRGQVIPCSEEEYEAMLTSSVVTFDPNGGTVDVTEMIVYYNQPYGEMPTPSYTGYTFTGWYTEPDGGKRVTEDDIVTTLGNQTLYAHWDASAFTVTWENGTGYTVTVKRAESPYANAAIGELTSGEAVYYGDVLSVTYKANAGYSISTKGSKAITVTADVTSADIYATTELIPYTATWNTGTGYTITVKRTSSPLAGAPEETLKSGATVYYGDVLSVTYKVKTGYTKKTSGKTSITVTGDVTPEDIYMTVEAKSITYNIVYVSSNGTDLGSSTVKKKYATTNTITPPAKSGYDTPDAQKIQWDSVDAKTITFTYTPSYVGDTWETGYITNDTYHKMDYDVVIEYRNRTATSVELYITWTASIWSTSSTGAYNTYGQWFKASVGSASTDNINVVPFGTWKSASTSKRSETAGSGWFTVDLSTTDATSLAMSVYYWQTNYNGVDMSVDYGIDNLDTTWYIDIPAY